MYSPRIIQRHVEQTEREFGIKLKRYDVGFCLDARERLDTLRKEDGSLKRAFTQAETDFIRNECLLSKFDFEYWAARYCTIDLDPVEGGGMGRLVLNEGQHIVLDKFAHAEDEEYDKLDRGHTCDGLLFIFNKARQRGLTCISRALAMHRLTLWHDVRAISAALDDRKIINLYDVDKKIYNTGLDKDDYSNKGGLPYWMRPTLGYDVKAGHLNFNLLGSRMSYEFSTQGSPIGQGGQFDFFHGTELAYWGEYPFRLLTRDLFPTLPKSPRTMALLESVSFGRSGGWYKMSKAIEAGRMARWRFCFIPWYVWRKKYISTPPSGWSPDETTQRHADMVWETSIKYVGLRYRLDREQMYWWEQMRAEHKESDDLASFLTNFCATPEEGFQHSNPTAVSHETMARLHDEAAATNPVPYVLRLNGTETADDKWSDKVPIYRAGKDSLMPAHPSELDHDPRGIVWIWEPPKRGSAYVMGIDPTNGIIPWDRNSRKDDDMDTDNGCIQILRKATEEGAPDVQVAEFVAPIGQDELGDVANCLGRVFGGNTEDGQCLAVCEVHLALGLAVQRKLIDHGYLNLWMWEHIDKLQVASTAHYGWYASPSAVRLLWEKGRRALALRTLTIRSTWLVEELADCIWDAGKMTANAVAGKHDDRVRGIFLAQWVARSWGAPESISTKEADEDAKTKVDWQKRAISWEDAQDEMNEQVESWLDE